MLLLTIFELLYDKATIPKEEEDEIKQYLKMRLKQLPDPTKEDVTQT